MRRVFVFFAIVFVVLATTIWIYYEPKATKVLPMGSTDVALLATNDNDGPSERRRQPEQPSEDITDKEFVAAPKEDVWKSEHPESIQAINKILRLDVPETTRSYRCEIAEFDDEIHCGNFQDPNWMEMLDDETLFQVGLTDPYAAYLSAGRLVTADPDRAFEYSLRSVALSGQLQALLGNKQPKDGEEITGQLLAELGQHSAVTSRLYVDILEMNGHQRSAAAPPLYWDTYLDKHPTQRTEMEATLNEWKAFIDAERRKVIGEAFFVEVSQ